jgi:hypothetical protein
VAVPGVHADGHDFVAAAAALGAAAAIVERPVAGAALPQIVVDDARRALATAAAWWYGDPSRELGVVGITGTDGKTTTSFLAAAVLEAGGISTGLITTAAAKVGSLRSANPEHVTTPEAPQLQRMLRAMVRREQAAVVETTSHGLALHRVAEIAYDIAIFTNLTHEHLELHGTFEAYREAKLSLFRGLGRAAAAAKRWLPPWPRDRDRQCRRSGRAALRGSGAGQPARASSPTARSARRRPRHGRRGGAAADAPGRGHSPLDGGRWTCAGRQVQRPQRPGLRWPSARLLAIWIRALRFAPGSRRRGRPRPDGASGLRPAVRRHRRLRPFAGIAGEGPRRARAHGLRRWRADRRLRLGRGT